MKRSLITLSAVLMLTGTGLAHKPREPHRVPPGPRYQAGCLFPGGFWFWGHPRGYAMGHRRHDGWYRRDDDRGRHHRRNDGRGHEGHRERGREGRGRH